MKRDSGTITPILSTDGTQVTDRAGRVKMRLRYYDAEGKRRHEVRWCGSEAEARDHIRAGQGAVGGECSWSAIAAAWAKEPGRTESYLQKVEHSVRLAVARLGDLSPQDTTPAAMKAHLAGRVRETSPAAARKDLAHLKAVARWARSEYIITEIPWEHIRPPKHIAKERPPVALPLLAAHLEALDEWTRPIVLWICLTGCRLQDAAGLREEQVEGDRVSLRVKGGDLPEYLLDDDLREVIAEARALKAKHSLRTQWLFCNSAAGRWTSDHLGHRIREQWDAIKSDATLHSLRHTFGTLAGKRFGADMVRAALAHRSRAASERYVHPDVDDRHEVGTAVRALLREHLPTLLKNGTQDGTRRDTSENTQPCEQTKTNTFTDPATGEKVALSPGILAEIAKYLKKKDHSGEWRNRQTQGI